jgi:hypothetical protein
VLFPVSTDTVPDVVWDYFISYTKADQEWARWVLWVLEQNGYTCFAQFANIPPASDFVQQMNDGLRRSRQVIAVLSPDYLRSEFATSELNAALGSDPIGRERKLIPVRVRPCQLDGMLATRVYVDLVGKESAVAVESLIQGVEAARIGLAAAASGSVFAKPPLFPGAAATPSASPLTSSPARGHTKILFVASERGTGLDLRGQFHSIEAAMQISITKGQVSLLLRCDLLAEQLADEINDAAPEIVHFSGKQNGERILVPSANGGVTTISATALTGLFRNLADTVRLVVVDTCRSLKSARELSAAVDFAIGVEGDIYDDDATCFYRQFYSALARGLTLTKAIGQATSTLELANVAPRDIPALICRPGIDGNAYQIAGIGGVSHRAV